MNRDASTLKTPYYLFDEKRFTDNYQKLVSSFREAYPNYQLSYSYKTNYVPYICNLVKKLGGYAEVVSDMEYALAKRLGYENDKIVYNGPAKGALLTEHVLAGGLNNIDNYEEAQRICQIAADHANQDFQVGVRINLDLGRGYDSRFGVQPDSAECDAIVSLLKQQHNITIRGLHCHISHSRDIEAWRMRADIMLAQADKIIEGAPAYISLGSGMFGEMSEGLSSQFGDNLPTYKDYAEAVLRPIAEHYATSDSLPIVFTEPGATVVSHYISFTTQVLNTRTIRGRAIATVDGSSYNLGSICKSKRLPYQLHRAAESFNSVSNADVAGFTCLEDDILYKAFEEPLSIGDRICFENVGGYSIVCKPPFIRPNCCMYAIRPDGELIEIMREETFEDVFSKFDFACL